MYLNLDLLYNVSYFLRLRYYKRHLGNEGIICTYHNNCYYPNWHKKNTVQIYKENLIAKHKGDLHGGILNSGFLEVEPFKIYKELYYALITYF